jgi:glycerophosphoryl diester phosphodiesterase
MKIIAHRGASGEYPENTLLAFEEAIVQGADGIECDVQYHQASGEFILLHDRYLDNKQGKRVHFNCLSFAEITSLPQPKNQTICTLAEVLQLIQNRCIINIEIKSAEQGVVLKQILTKLQKIIEQAIKDQHIKQEQVILSSFNHPALVVCQVLLPKVKTAALIVACPVNYAEIAFDLSVEMINPAVDFMTLELIQDAHEKGLQVWVYTVDHPDDILRCLTYNVDAIFTNFPRKARNFANKLPKNINKIG